METDMMRAPKAPPKVIRTEVISTIIPKGRPEEIIPKITAKSAILNPIIEAISINFSCNPLNSLYTSENLQKKIMKKFITVGGGCSEARSVPNATFLRKKNRSLIVFTRLQVSNSVN
jgi:hypothetical protein